MLRLRLLLLGLLLCASPGVLPCTHVRADALPTPSQRYVLDVTLDPRTHVVSGRQTLRFTNHSAKPLRELDLHLYMNAFRDRKTVFMREGGAQLRAARLKRKGGIELLELRDAAGRDLLAAADHELIEGDHTQLRVRLSEPLAVDAELELRMRFITTLPEIVARSGFAGDFHMVAQWFPKLARLRPEGGFATFPYHGLGEFYADFASYTLRLTVPKGYVVAASGRRIDTRAHGSLRTDTYEASAVHDLAFAAYPHFVRHEASAGPTRIALYAPRGYELAARRQLHVAQAALAYFGARYGSYPYPVLTIVLPPRNAQAAAGMEYPTLFTSAGPWFAFPASWPDPTHDAVVAHELAHQWFAGTLASNEVAMPMLDEGLAQWATLDFLRAYYARPGSALAGTRSLGSVFEVARELFDDGGATTPSSLLPAHGYSPATLGRAVYLRPALVLWDLEQRHGRARRDRALADYTRRQRFRHPDLAALLEAFDRAYGPGFGARVLVPALQGTHDDATTPTRPRRSASLFADVFVLAQSWLRALGP